MAAPRPGRAKDSHPAPPAAPAASGRPPDFTPPRRYVLPPGLRPDLAKPFGPVLSGAALLAALKGGAPLVAVGDHVSLTLRNAQLVPCLFVCDYRTQRGASSNTYRRALGSWGTREWHVPNPPATITREAWLAVREALRDAGPDPKRIVVEGEEDLLGIPCFLEAPDGARVLYGMPGEGVVVVEVHEALRERVRRLLAAFERE